MLSLIAEEYQITVTGISKAINNFVVSGQDKISTTC